MRSVQIRTSAFKPGTSRDESHEIMSILLDTLVRLNLAYLRRHPDTPNPYKGGVRYRQEPRGQEQWLTIPEAIAQGHADCEDLGCWLAAYKTFHGQQARACFKWARKPYQGRMATVYHIVTCTADGKVEDPSRVLGMGWADPWKPLPRFFARRMPAV